MNEYFIDTMSWAGESKQRSTQWINEPLGSARSIWENTRCPTGGGGDSGTPVPPQCPIVQPRPRVKPGESVFALPAGPSYLISAAAATMGQVYSPFYLRERANRGPGPGRPGRPAAGQPGWW